MESNLDIVIRVLEASLLTQNRSSHSTQFIYARPGPGRRALFGKVEPLSAGGVLTVLEHFRKRGYDAVVEGSFVMVSKPGAKAPQYEGFDYEDEGFSDSPLLNEEEQRFSGWEAYSPLLRNALLDSLYVGDFEGEGEPPYSRQTCLAVLQRAMRRDSEIPPEQRDGYDVPPEGVVRDALNDLRAMYLPSACSEGQVEGFIFTRYTTDGVPEYKTGMCAFTRNLEDPNIQVYHCDYRTYLAVNGAPPSNWIRVAYRKTSTVCVMLSLPL